MLADREECLDFRIECCDERVQKYEGKKQNGETRSLNTLFLLFSFWSVGQSGVVVGPGYHMRHILSQVEIA